MEKSLPRITFTESIKLCFTNQFFTGRARRSEFWWFTLFFVIVSIGRELISGILYEYETIPARVVIILLFLAHLLVAYFQLAVTFRRLHDIGKSGWWAAILAIVFLSAAITRVFGIEISGLLGLIYFMLFLIVVCGFCSINSQKEENEYGLSPKYDEEYEREDYMGETGPLTGLLGVGLGCPGCLAIIIIGPAIAIFLARWLCDIDPYTEYTWYSGIWHGLFFLPNLVRSWFGDALYKAEIYTTGYNIWWWITVVWMCMNVLFGRK